MSQTSQDVTQPLLQPDTEALLAPEDLDDEEDFLAPPPESELPLLNPSALFHPQQEPDTFFSTSMGLSKSILGAGMMASDFLSSSFSNCRQLNGSAGRTSLTSSRQHQRVLASSLTRCPCATCRSFHVYLGCWEQSQAYFSL